MKVKLKVDKKAIQDFFLHHLEKLVFAAVMVCFLWFVFGAIGREKFEKAPQDLVLVSTDAERKVQNTPGKAPEDVKDYYEIIKGTMGGVGLDSYKHPVLWCPPVFDPPPKRGEPLLYTVRELRAAPGFAKVKVMTAGGPGSPLPAVEGVPPGMEGAPGMEMGPMAPMGIGAESTQGDRWVIVTGLVPHVEQIKAYIDAFRYVASDPAALAGGGLRGAGPAMGPAMVPGMEGMAPGPGQSRIDMPVYVHYHVQRVEVDGPDDVIDEAAWEAGTIHVANAKKEARARWGGATGAIIMGGDAGDKGVWVGYIIEALDFPLPSFADRRTFDATFAHPPQIPLLRRRPPQMVGPDGRLVAREKPDEPAEAKPDAPKPDAPKPDDQPDRPADLPQFGPGMGEVPGMMPGMMPGMAPGAEGFDPMMMEMPGGPGLPGAPGAGRVRMPDYKLFRFIDRTVEPGKRYRYRARLMLVNPNYNVDPRLLERIELRKERFVLTPWSDPTDVVETPRDDRLLVLSARPSASFAYEASAKVALLKWINKEGELANKVDEKVVRGQVVNLAKQKWPEEEKTKPKPKPSAKPTPGGPPMVESDLEKLFGPQDKKGKKAAEKGKSPAPSPFMPEIMGGVQKEPLEIDYLTENLVLDLRGGHRVDVNGQGRPPSSDRPELNAPGEVLVLDPEGRLVVRNELDDAAEYEKIQEMAAPKYDPMMGPGFGPGYGPGMEVMMPGVEGVPGQLMPGERPAPGERARTPPRAPRRDGVPPRG